MQLLSIQSVEEDPYKNTLFDDPVRVSSFYIQNVLKDYVKDKDGFLHLQQIKEDIYLGALQLKIQTISYENYVEILNHYFDGLYKEEYIHDFYCLKRGNDKGVRWHEIIGDSFIENEYLLTELWYSDSFENERIGYFVMDALHPKRGCFKKIDNLYELNSNIIELTNEQKLRYMLLSEKIGNEAFFNRYDISINQLEDWKSEPIKNYLEYLKENG